MILYIKRALREIIQSPFLNIITITTIAFSILIISSFALFFVNATSIMNSWKQEFRIMAYLKPVLETPDIGLVQKSIEEMDGVQAVRFISKETAIEKLKAQMVHQSSLFEGLAENPLPDAFEIHISDTLQSDQEMETIANRINALDSIEKVEFGRKWIGRVLNLIQLFRLAAYAMGALFFFAATFIVANTIRLVLYSKIREIDIMRLVGATDRFIRTPFYIQGIIHGAVGAIVGFCLLYAAYGYLTSHIGNAVIADLFHIRFLSFNHLILILLGSMSTGWLGCYISLKQFLNA